MGKYSKLSLWYTASQAATFLSQKAGVTISPAYVRQLALRGKIETVQLHARCTLYSRADVEAYVMHPHRSIQDTLRMQ